MHFREVEGAPLSLGYELGKTCLKRTASMAVQARRAAPSARCPSVAAGGNLTAEIVKAQRAATAGKRAAGGCRFLRISAVFRRCR